MDKGPSPQGRDTALSWLDAQHAGRGFRRLFAEDGPEGCSKITIEYFYPNTCLMRPHETHQLTRLVRGIPCFRLGGYG